MKRRFTVKNKKWTMYIVPDSSEKLIMDGQKCCGQIFFRERAIYLNEELMEDDCSFLETITHELTHAFIFSYALDEETFQKEEFICEFMAVYGKDIIAISNSLFKFFQSK